eukprot:391819_1
MSQSLSYMKQYFLVDGYIHRIEHRHLKQYIIAADIFDLCLCYFWSHYESGWSRWTRPMTLSHRPCSEGKKLTDDQFDKLTNDYFSNKTNRIIFMKHMTKYKILNRKLFLNKLVHRAITYQQTELLSLLLPLLLDDYIILSIELDDCFIEYFSNYTCTEIDDPKINIYCASLLAQLITDEEIKFNDVLKWIVLDVRANQPNDDMLQWYKGDGVRNYINNNKTITKAMDFLANLLLQLKATKFNNSKFCTQLISSSDFRFENYLNQNDWYKDYNYIFHEWKITYGLLFAF